MYYNDYNRPQEPWEKDIARAADPAHEEPEKPKKKKSGAAKFVALGLVCALVGGFAGGGIAYWAGSSGGSTTLTEGTRTPTVVNVSQVDSQTPMTAAQIYNKYVGSTVGITTQITTNVWGQPVSSAAAGSGFVISADGYILTNYHVIDGATSIKVSFSDGTAYDATLVGGEEGNDIAVLKIEATGLTPVVIGNSDNLQVGEWVGAIGNPLGELTFSMTQGSVSAKDRNITMSDGTVMNYIQTDTAINSGNSGGPLFDSYGQVVGITSAKLSNNSGSSGSEASIEGLGFAIPMNDVKGMVQDIIAHGYVTGKPYMGVTVKTIPEAVAKEYGLAQGAQVQSVDSTSCSAKAGLQVGDIITGIDQTTITSSADLIEALKSYQSGQTATLAVNRSGAILNLEITFDEDSPQRREAQKEEQEAQAAQQEEQQQQQSGNSFFWPFSGSNPWMY